MMTIRRFPVLAAFLLLVAAVSGCSTQPSSPYLNAGQTFRASGEAFGLPVSGSVRVGVSGGGVFIQPSVNMRQLRFGR